MDTLTSRYRRWFEQERDAIDKTFGSLRSVPTERRGEEPYRRATTILGHVVAARGIWLARLGAIAPPPGSMFPTEVDLDQLQSDWDRLTGEWSGYLEQVDDAALARSFEYQSSDGGHFRNTLEDALTQLFTHSAYHRGQIAMLVRTAGGVPATTDFIYWSREEA